MAGYDDILNYLNKLFAGDNLAEELQKDKYKTESDLYRDPVSDMIEQSMEKDWRDNEDQKGAKWSKRLTLEEFKKRHHSFLKVVDKMKDGVSNMQISEEVTRQRIINYSKYSHLNDALMPAHENEANLRAGLEFNTINREWMKKGEPQELFNYDKAVKEYGQNVIDKRVNKFQEKYPLISEDEARREIITRLQSEDRIRDIEKADTPFDLAWAKWTDKYGALRTEPRSLEQDLEGLQEMKHYASYGGYFPVYKDAGLTSKEGKSVKSELQTKIDYLVGLQTQADIEIKEYEDRKSGKILVSASKKEEIKPIIEEKKLSRSEIFLKEMEEEGEWK